MWIYLNRVWDQSLDGSLFNWKCKRVRPDPLKTDSKTRQLIVTPFNSQYLQPLIIAQDISQLPWTPKLWTCSTGTTNPQLKDYAIVYALLLFDFYVEGFELRVEQNSLPDFLLFKEWTSRIFNDLSRTRDGHLSKLKQQEFDQLIAWYLEKCTQADTAA